MIPLIRYRLRKWKSKSWPTVRATIQTSQVLRGGPTRYQALIYRSLLGYEYTVSDTRYSGLFVLIADDEATTKTLRNELLGKEVVVRYNPMNPEMSFLIEAELAGKRVVQNPMWLK